MELSGSSTARVLDGVKLEKRTSFTMFNPAQLLGLSNLKMLIICRELLTRDGVGMPYYIPILVVSFAGSKLVVLSFLVNIYLGSYVHKLYTNSYAQTQGKNSM